MPSKQIHETDQIRGSLKDSNEVFTSTLADLSEEITELKDQMINISDNLIGQLTKRTNTASMDALVAKQAAERGLARKDKILISNSLSTAAEVMNDAETNSIPSSYLCNLFSLSDSSNILNDSNLTSSKRKAILDHENLLPDVEQDIFERMADDGYYDTLLDILTEYADDHTIDVNTTLTDVHIYKTLTINSGITLTLNSTTPEKPTIIFVKNLINNGTINRSQQTQTIGEFLRTSTSHISGLGGDGGDDTSNDAYDGLGGGRDGSGHSKGTAYTQNYTLKTTDELIKTILKGSFQTFIEDEQSKSALTSPYTLPDIFGASTNSTNWYAGGGILIYTDDLTNTGTIQANGENSCSGGEIIIKTTTLNNTGIIQTNGGNGITGSYSGYGGGGGGLIYILYTTIQSEGTLQAIGGTGGGGTYPATNGANGTVTEIAI